MLPVRNTLTRALYIYKFKSLFGTRIMPCTLNVRAPGRGNVFKRIRVRRNRRYGLCKLRVEIHIAVTGSVLAPYYYIIQRTFFPVRVSYGTKCIICDNSLFV